MNIRTSYAKAMIGPVIGLLSLTANAQSVNSFTIVNADSESDVATFTNNATVSLSATPRINVRANTSKAASVVFTQGGSTRTENATPFAFKGNTGSDYAAWAPAPGVYQITVTPYSSTDAKGMKGAAATLTLTVVAGGLPPAPTPTSIFTPGDFSASNPSWSAIKNSVDANGPVKGTRISVDNPGIENSPIGNRTFLKNFKIHISSNSTVPYERRDQFTRWYQEEGNTQVFRLFQNDENTQSSRALAARSEAFAADDSFNYADNQTNIWSGRFHVVNRANEGFSIFQSKATSVSDPDIHNISDAWSVQLNISNSGQLVVNERRESDSVVYSQDMTGRSFDAEVRDDGKNYVVFIDGVQRAAGTFFRHPSLKTTFRWGMYLGADIVNNGTAVMYVSGARVTTRPGRLD
jgi:hypothetical protein